MRYALSSALLLWLAAVPASAQEDPETEGTAQEAYVVLARSCASCHGSGLQRPKGNFGFVLDLGRLGRAGEYIVRGKPEASGLFRVMEDGSMPPPRSSVPALTEDDLAAVRSWILDGAPTGPIDLAALPALPDYHESSAVVREVGQLHPMLLHLPIGLLLAAALAETVFALSREQRFRSAAEYCLLLGTAGACVATLTGWAFASDLNYAMTAHRWLAVATSLFALAACQLASRVRRLPAPEAPTRDYRIALTATILLLVVTSHLGGTATWGF